MSTKTKQRVLIIAIPIILFLIASVVLVNVVFDSFGFNSHTDYDETFTADDYGLVGKETDLTTSDNVKIHIYEVVVPEPQGVVIMLSGIKVPSITHFYGQAKLVQEAGFASVLVETRGHGKSEGDRVGLAVDDVKDVEAAIEYIKSQPQYKDLPIVTMGLSMGAATAINSAAVIEDIDAVITLAAYTSWADVCKDFLKTNGLPEIVGYIMRPGIDIHGLLFYGFDYFKYVPEKTIKKIGDKPILIIHCKDDKSVSVGSAEKLMANYTGSNAELWIRESGGHLVVQDRAIHDPFDDTEYCEKILSFLERVKGSDMLRI